MLPRRLDNRRGGKYLRSLFREISDDPDQVEVRSLLLLSLWIGNALIAADHGAVSRSEVMVRALDWLEA